MTSCAEQTNLQTSIEDRADDTMDPRLRMYVRDITLFAMTRTLGLVILSTERAVIDAIKEHQPR